MSPAKLGGVPEGVKARRADARGPPRRRGGPLETGAPGLARAGSAYSSHPSTVSTAMATPIRLSPAMMPLETGTV